MSIENILPEYALMAQALQQQGIALSMAEMHGLVSGLLCGGYQDTYWLALVHDLTNEGQAFSQRLSQPLQAIYQHTRHALEDNRFTFQLMLPDDENHDVFARADALAGWVNHFLLGLGMAQPQLEKITGEVGEVIDDLRSIAQLGCDAEEDPNELSQSLAEVLEYVRVAAMLCYNEFTQDTPPVPKITLH